MQQSKSANDAERDRRQEDHLPVDMADAEPQRIGFAALLWQARNPREWCCEACRQAAIANPQRW
jgi:hypothetical protein